LPEPEELLRKEPELAARFLQILLDHELDEIQPDIEPVGLPASKGRKGKSKKKRGK
jgi:hypothetical protein